MRVDIGLYHTFYLQLELLDVHRAAPGKNEILDKESLSFQKKKAK